MEDSRSSGREKAVLETEDLLEEEVWDILKPKEGSNPNPKTRKKKAEPGPSSFTWPAASVALPVPRATANSGGKQESDWVARRSSAPVGIPNWPRALKMRFKKNWDDAHYNDDHGANEAENIDDDDVDDETGPPHEYLERRLARTQIASHSMCEGVGRTLKGRDLSKLRNAILSETGFIEN